MGLFDINDTDVTSAAVARSHLKNTKEIYLRSCQMVVTGGYQDHVRRPFEVQVDEDDLVRLSNATNRGRNISSGSIANVAGNFIRPSSEYEDYVRLETEWVAPRIRFIMEFIREGMGGVKQRYVYVGYTDYVGVDMNGNIDPNMALHLTASLHFRETASLVNGIPTTRNTLVAYDQILRNDESYDRENASEFMDEKLARYMMRPNDVFTNIASSAVVRDAGYGSAYPMMSRIGRKPCKSKRTNLLPATYLSSVFNSAKTAFDNEVDLEWGHGADGYEDMIEKSNENIASEDPLFILFGYDTDINSNATLYWSDISKLFPMADDDRVTVISFPSQLQHLSNRNMEGTLERSYKDERSSLNGWNDYRAETMIATAIAQQLPSVMMSNLIRDIRFSITNEVASGLEEPFQWMIGDRRRRNQEEAIKFSINGMPLDMESDLFQGFQRRFEQLIMMPLTNYNQLDLSLLIDARCDGDIFISVSLNGGEPRDYKMASFADSHTSPVMTNNRDRYDNVTNDLFNLTQQVLSF